MANPVPIVVFLSIMAFASVGLMSVLSYALAPSPPIPQPQRLSLAMGVGDFQWQQRLCICRNDYFGLASNERNVSNDNFDFMGGMPDPRGLSALAPFWGQFIDHDIVLSKTNKSDERFSVEMTPFDAILNLTRSEFRLVQFEDDTCRETPNLLTPTIDASTVYGDINNPAWLTHLRNGTGCHLRTSAGNLLPLDPHDSHSFEAGDVRNTEHAILASLHTLWMREHNRLCDVLREEKPFWNDELRFWKARDVVIAKIQHITYTEWLPLMMGSQFYLLDNITTLGQDTRIGLEFSVAGFRAGHSMIPDPIGPFTLPSIFMNRQLIIDNGIEPLLQASFSTQAQRMDNMVVDGLRNFLFATNNMTIGEDLVTRNLFAGRERGMGTYEDIVSCYGLDPLPEVGGEEELFVALLKEPVVPGSSLPRTIAHIWAEQFKRLRDNDYYFYTRNWEQNLGRRFFYEVNTTTLSSVIRLNTGLVSPPEEVFLV